MPLRCVLRGVALLAGLLSLPGAHSAPVEADAPYAVIDWTDPLNPHFVRIDATHFLLTTHRAMVVWDAAANSMGGARGWPVHTAPEPPRARLAQGTVLAGSSHTATDVPYGSLVWWDAATQAFAQTLPLPAGTLVKDLLVLDAQHALACLRTGVRPGDAFDAGQREARVVAVRAGTLAWAGHAIAPALLRQAGIRGPVDGAVPQDDTGAPVAPVLFNTLTCEWEAHPRPGQFADMVDPHVTHRRLPDGRTVILQAEGFSPAQNGKIKLDAPLLWDAAGGRWTALDAPALDANRDHPDWRSTIDEPIVTSGFQVRFAEFLDPATLRWSRSLQQLPETYSPSILALDGDVALAFLHEHGHVMRLTRMAAPAPGRFAYPHYYPGAIALAGDGLLLPDGGAGAPSSSYGELVRPGQRAASRIAPPPAPWVGMGGVELADRSALVLGGLPPCAARRQCKATPDQPAYRYFPAQDRWETVPGLAVAAAHAYPWPDSATNVSNWARTDLVARPGGDVVYLEAQPAWQRASGDPAPWPATLKRWAPGAAPVTLAVLPHGRSDATVLALRDGRVAILGGQEQLAGGAIVPSRAVDLFDPRGGTVTTGAATVHPGGRAYQLANGRVVKLTVASENEQPLRYLAEVADPALRHWKKLPPFPLQPSAVTQAVVAGNRLLLPGADVNQTVVWDDASQAWRIWTGWLPMQPLSIHPLDGQRALVRDAESVEIVRFPQP